MGENKGHGDKAPSYPELDEMGSAASRAGSSAGNQQRAESEQDAGLRQDGNLQGSQRQAGASHQSAGGQRQGQQKGGQHASGGIPASDDLNGEQDKAR
ncbi:hypothetical protein ABIB38_001182 [Massilia sp. UYP11]|uniref:hypothetical protein n=1 Tax=Massilia sp. UYP11 TaxID=1756385 RepID=UPI003D191404